MISILEDFLSDRKQRVVTMVNIRSGLLQGSILGL